MSFFHFSKWYLDYQLAYYEQIALQQSWLKTNDVKNGNTFIYIGKNKGAIDGDSFYTFNAMSKQVYNDSSRFFAKNPEQINFITQNSKREQYVLDPAYCMEQYDLNNIELSGIMIVTYNIKEKDCLSLWYKEIFEREWFNEEIEKYINYQYIPVEKDESSIILESIESGTVVTTEDLFQILKIR